MSVSLIVKNKNGSQMLPVATEQFFKEHWLPISKKLKLKYVPLFQTGLPVRKEDLPEILEELSLIKDSLQNKNEVNMQITTRLNLLIDKLQALKNEDFIDLYIG